MSQLFFTERGRAMMDNNEEITRWRWAKKVFKLPQATASAEADLWLLLQSYEENTTPLEIHLNGEKLVDLMPRDLTPNVFWWYRVPVPTGRLQEGANQLELRAANPAMNGWMLAVENGHAHPDSFLSTDQGKSWQNESMGPLSSLRGEYVIRLRSHSDQLHDATPPAIVYEDPHHPRVKEAWQIVPASIRQESDPWRQLLLLRSWAASSWKYRNSGRIYAPWDPWTILDWAQQDRGHGFDGVIVMCVHYAAVFVSLASALGHAARCVVVTGGMDTPMGHFMTEVWDARNKQWVLHDPNYDVHYKDKDQLLSAIDIAQRNHRDEPLAHCVVEGPGKPTGPQMLLDAFNETFASGDCFLCTGIWATNQYVSDPSRIPPGHGKLAYCETDIIWYDPPGMDLVPMFPYRAADRSYFDNPPAQEDS